MTASRKAAVELAALHVDRPDPSSSLVHSCRAELRYVCSVGLTLAVDAALAQRVSLAAEGPLARRGEALQINLGEGPCVEALKERRTVLVPDLDDPYPTVGWPVYAQQARAHGIRAAFALCALLEPDHSGPQPGLVMSVYRDRPGPLPHKDLETVRAHVHAADILLLAVPRPGENTAADAWFLHSDAVVHQATGMISYRHHVTAGQALALLRAHAHACQTDVRDLAHTVVHEGLHLPPLPPPDPTNP
ncbi:GAF and ANTAR domain-containing protein [Streptomyces venezuelae]|uniref:GAF and ANTAR domain-containing protein n=1 Tax=Streptomyces venezuelae TaxID=54571 RepID=UPI0034438486